MALEPLSLQLWPLVSGRDIDKLQEQGRKQEQNKQNHSCDFLFSSVNPAKDQHDLKTGVCLPVT